MSTLKVEEIQHPSNSNNAVSVASDSSVSLKHSGSAKLATTSTGVSVTGTCAATAYTGDGSALTGISGGITVQDEGSALSTAATTLDFVGAGVTASGTGASKTITVPGGGGALELISKTTVSSSAANISISGLVQDAYYIIIGKKITFSTNTKVELAFLDSSGSEIATSQYLSYYRTGSSVLTASDNRLNTYAGGDTTGQQFYLRLNTTTNENGGYLKITSNGTNSFCNIHFQSGTVGLYGLYVRAQAGTINVGSEFLIYKFKES